jgi:hypothetical protein
MTSVSGAFEAIEIVNPAINHDGVPSAFAFLQSDLYNETQPGLTLDDLTYLGLKVNFGFLSGMRGEGQNQKYLFKSGG